MTPRNMMGSRIAMKGEGYYSLHTRGAKHVIDNTTELALGALEEMTIDEADTSFAIADFGAADGGTSLDLVGNLIAEVRKRVPNRCITVTYTDLPRNDYSALFQVVHGEREDVTSYLPQHDRVWVFAAGTSFYTAVFPPQSVDFGFSATAMHWLSRVPGTITDHVHAVGACGEELERYRLYAMTDWETILTERARELKHGARLVMSNFCVDEQGYHIGNTGGVNMFDTFNELWRAFVDDGLITEQEYQSTNFPQYYKTLDEYCAPFQDPKSIVYRMGLRLDSAQTRIVPCPYRTSYLEHGDATRFAESFVPTTRSWSETVFLSALDNTRSAHERHQIVDHLYDRYVERVKTHPDGHAMDYVHVYMVVRKE